MLVDVRPDERDMFVLAAVSLLPLAWLIGEATEHAGEHTGPRIGGLLNASSAMRPEVIIAVIAVNDNLPGVVRSSMAGKLEHPARPRAPRYSSGRTAPSSISAPPVGRLGLVIFAVLLLTIPSVAGWHGDPNRHSLALLRTRQL